MLRAMLGKALALQARSARLFTPCVAVILAPALEGGLTSGAVGARCTAVAWRIIITLIITIISSIPIHIVITVIIIV